MLKIEDILVGASYEVHQDGERFVSTIVQHYGGDVCYKCNHTGPPVSRCATSTFAERAVRRVYPCTVYLSAPEGAGLLENQLPAAPAIAPREDDPICVCDNCEYEARQQTLPPAQDIYSRLSIGDMFSDVECPKCHALCYPKQDKPVSLVPEHDAEEQMMKNVKWLTDHFYVLQRLLGLKLKGGWVTTVEDVMREMRLRFETPNTEKELG